MFICAFQGQAINDVCNFPPAIIVADASLKCDAARILICHPVHIPGHGERCDFIVTDVANQTDVCFIFASMVMTMPFVEHAVAININTIVAPHNNHFGNATGSTCTNVNGNHLG